MRVCHTRTVFFFLMDTRLRPDPRLGIERFDARVSAGMPVQDTLDSLGEPLSEATFVVVDLETTGTSPINDKITEIGAVKVRGGEVIGEFATLVNPRVAIPPQITVLTGITTSMVLDAPTIDSVLPSFAEFAAGSILVAHNARFDIGFLRAAAKALHLNWSPTPHIDTLALARRVVTKDEVRNFKLASLARLFHATTVPDHRALSDARATVDVLHGLFSRLGTLGVTHVPDLYSATDPVPPARRRKVSLAESLPTGPGVYSFIGPSKEVLYVGTAKNLRRRVRQYFTSAPDRRRIGEMVDLALTVDVIECPTALEAQVRELRLIQEHQPAYNQRSKRPTREPWVRLTDEPLPRLSIVRQVPSGAVAIGPFSGAADARAATEALEDIGMRGCTRILPLQIRTEANACALAEMGRCVAPCVSDSGIEAYTAILAKVRAGFATDTREIFSELRQRMDALAQDARYEHAAVARDRMLALLRGIHTHQRLSPWWNSRETVAARWSTDRFPGGAWEILISKYGRLAATGVCPPTRNPLAFAGDLTEASAHVDAPTRLGGAATREETALIARWMETPGVRLISHDGPPIAWPIHGAMAQLHRLRELGVET